MENKEKLFENSGQNREFPNEFPKENVFEGEGLKNYEKVEEELSSLFNQKKKEIEETKSTTVLNDGDKTIQFEEKIKELLATAFAENIEKAINKASSYNDPFLLDEFHDRLIEELRKKNFN